MSGFTLIELILAIALISLVVFASTTMDIVGHNIFKSAERDVKIHSEAEIAMRHISKYLQLGIGDMSNPRNPGADPFDASGCSRGVYILNSSGYLTSTGTGSSIFIKIDYNSDGQFTGLPVDRTVRYDLVGNVINCTINPGPLVEEVTAAVIEDCQFSYGAFDNQVNVTIDCRNTPGQLVGPKNPETTLSSSVILIGMSSN